VPRLVNQLCDLSLVYAYTKNANRVTRLTVQQVLDDGVFFGGNLVASLPVFNSAKNNKKDE
jgi:general secretion pathway protein A